MRYFRTKYCSFNPGFFSFKIFIISTYVTDMRKSKIYNLSLNTDCTICRCNLNSESIYAQEKCIDSYVVTGGCGHSFHYECINPWVSTQPNCPICSSKWVYINKPK